METAIKIEGLTKKFGDFTAVDRISFEVGQGEIFGLLGPNGAGKSTTIKMLCGLLAPSDGRGQVAGLDIKKENEKIKSQIGYMSQKFSLYNDLTVEENIDFFSGLYQIPADRKKGRREWIIGMAGLKDHRRSLTGSLSGGWKQRLAIGCAMIHQPKIIFLDEPTSGVDPLSRRSFWTLINELASEGITVLVTTHYMDEAENCQRLALIDSGQIVALDTPNNLKQQLGKTSLEQVFVSLMRKTGS